MGKNLTLKHHRGTPSDVAETLNKPISRDSIAGTSSAPLGGRGTVVTSATWRGSAIANARSGFADE